jgi:hypothetical protein
MLLTLLSQPSFCIYRKKFVYFNGKSKEHLENLKTTSGDSYLGLDLSIHVNKSQIHLVIQTPFCQYIHSNL